MSTPRRSEFGDPALSVVVPVYNNAATVAALVQRLEQLQVDLAIPVEAVFAVDGSPDDSEEVLAGLLSTTSLSAQLISHTRNFGSFAAIRTGLEHATAPFLAVLAADLQEPPELVREFYEELSKGGADIVVGVRRSRSGDPAWIRMTSTIFWRLYRRIVNRDIPIGGVDVYACTSQVRDVLLRLDEARSSQIALLYWVGFRRSSVAYDRQPRTDGARSGWTFRRRLRYMADSAFAFSDLPIQALLWLGGIASLVLGSFALVALVARAAGWIKVSGYAPLVLLNAAGFTSVLFALGLVGSYTWRAYENTKGRPLAIVARQRRFENVEQAHDREREQG